MCLYIMLRQGGKEAFQCVYEMHVLVWRDLFIFNVVASMFC